MFRNSTPRVDRQATSRVVTSSKEPLSDPLTTSGEQSLSDADQTAAEADQAASDADEVASVIDQNASDADQAAADRQHAAIVDPTPAELTTYHASKRRRLAVSFARQANRLRRARSAGDRDVTTQQRDRMADARDGRDVADKGPIDS